MTAGIPRVLAVITARGGSKGLPRKNLRFMAGRPLLHWTVEAAASAACVDRVVLSTDSEEIAAAGRAAGAEVPFLRPAHLASDTASSLDVLEHALETCGPCETLLLLQPTSPLRRAADIDAAFDAMQRAGADSCVSVCPAPKPPWLMYGLAGDGTLAPVMPPELGGQRRQDHPEVYVLNGAIYFVAADRFRLERKILGSDTLGHIMAAEESIDIDTADEFARAETRLEWQIAHGQRMAVR